jgi:hypothetical protein
MRYVALFIVSILYVIWTYYAVKEFIAARKTRRGIEDDGVAVGWLTGHAILLMIGIIALFVIYW